MSQYAIGAHVHIFVSGRIVNAIITELLQGGRIAVLTDSVGDARFTCATASVRDGWLMLGVDARSSGLGLPS